MTKLQKSQIIKEAMVYLKKHIEKDTTGHDFYHTMRVLKTSVKIAKKEGGDIFTIQLAAIFHDIADWKFNSGDLKLSEKYARNFLEKHKIPSNTINNVCDIISNLSFKGGNVKDNMKTLEGKIVQDADRLDALGAIGIARAFAYGGKTNRKIYDPSIKPILHDSFKKYRISKSHTINHFYEKLLLLKNRMNTNTAIQISKKRHDFIKNFLKNFFIEWESKDIIKV